MAELKLRLSALHPEARYLEIITRLSTDLPPVSFTLNFRAYAHKFKAVDTGIRNSRLNFRQDENTHLMENAIYNELIRRDYSVDVGVVEMFATVDGKRCRKRYEVDFVVNNGNMRFYIQSAWNIPDNEKREQETFSLRHIGDNFRKVVVTGNPYEKPWTDRSGITFIGIVPFLLDPRSLETL